MDYKILHSWGQISGNKKTKHRVSTLMTELLTKHSSNHLHPSTRGAIEKGSSAWKRWPVSKEIKAIKGKPRRASVDSNIKGVFTANLRQKR